nr:cytochrome P450 4c3-like [Onthophagus taurus]XP_022901357.1 cytochrome P450 4c3-like [Onthophagus taurus]
MLPIIYLVLIFSFLIYYFIKFKEIHKIPGPSFFNTFFRILWGSNSSKDVFNHFKNLNSTYGDVAKIWINPLKPTIVTTNLKYIEYLLTSSVHLDKARVFDFLRPYIGLGLASSTGQQWKLHRKLLNPVFHTKILEKYLNDSEKYNEKLVEKLKKEKGKFIDVFPIIHEHTMNVLCGTFLRTKKQSVIGEKYLDARRYFYGTVIQRLMSLLWQYETLYKLTKSYQEQTKSCNILKAFSRTLVESYKEELKTRSLSDYVEKKEFLDVLFEDGNFSEEEIMDQVNTFIIAGHDTSESLMSFIFFELARHPEVQKNILEESISILGKDKNVEPTYSQILQMKYLEATIKEVMRLYTLVPLLDRNIKEDITIDGRTIPAGTDITICAYSLHRNPDHFPEPEKFDPERFMPGNVEKIHPFAYIPFALGPRICIGKTFAMTTMKATITKIIRNFELVSLNKNENLEVTTEFVLKPLNTVNLKFLEREII